MWLFSSPNEKKPSDWDERLAEFERRLKMIEREHDDLHASYRKLRATQARGQVGEPQPDRARVTDGSVAQSKDELRSRFLPRPKSNGG